MAPASKAAPLLITHSAHPGHVLKLFAGSSPFQCDGCRQYSDDERWYRCEPCDYDLHVCCALLRTYLTHPLFPGRIFAFLHRPPSVPGYSCRSCDGCGDLVLGFVYHNAERQLDLHPQCASLATVLTGEEGVFILSEEAPVRGNCGLCGQGKNGRRGRFWCYRFNYADGEPAYVHVACLMELRGQGTLQSAPSRRSGRFLRFCKIALTVARVAHAVTTMDPVGFVTAVAGHP
ncbi:unnamed protein product [Triticum turgidum subsp. durum]|uniref:DC1 domain-containing protein n=1 Tax=Triticum turgidum subsp. durum TaxID=4567 RepID=A0A9R0VF72_TRITD|nr:unnamed protein product [Triticum turgidum subsp. durum]